MKRPAFIVIDIVNDFLANWPEGAKTRLLAATNDIVRLMRQRDYPITWVRQEFEPDLSDAFREMISKDIRITIRGTDGCQIVSSLEVIPSDAVVVKKRYGAFFGTGLMKCSITVSEADSYRVGAILRVSGEWASKIWFTVAIEIGDANRTGRGTG